MRPRLPERLRDLWDEGWAGLRAHRLRSALSALGILFGVAAVIGILSIGEGARREQDELIAKLGILNFQIHNRDLSGDPEQEQEIRRVSDGLTLEDADALAAALPEARRVGAARKIDLPELVPRPRDVSRIELWAADPEWLATSHLQLSQGRPLTERDEATMAQVCLLGDTARRELFGARPVLGQRIRVDDVWLTVVGVFDDGVSSGAEVEGVDLENRDGSIVMPLSTGLNRVVLDDGSPPLTEIQVALSAAEHVSGHTQLAKRLLQRLHHEQDDYEIVVPMRLLEQTRAQQRIFNLVMGMIAGISLLVGGIGIMNIMLASVLERTKEIGIRLAIGARPADIRALFLFEASLISLIGGLSGVALGFAIAKGVAAFTGWSTAVSPGAVLLATALSTAEGVIFGFIPAQRAATLPPAIAVRTTN